MQTRKITFEVPEDTYQRLVERVPWGNRKHLLVPIIDVILRAVETDGPIVIGAVMAGSFRLQWEAPGTVQNLNNRSGKDAA